MRPEVEELGKMGPIPVSEDVLRANLDDVVGTYERLIMSITKPVTDEEARVLVKVLGSDDGFGLVWPLVGLIESAPGWPLLDCLQSTQNEWVRTLRQRVDNAK